MQVNLTTSPGVNVRVLEQPSAARESERPADQAEFSQFEALNRTLSSESDMRAEEVKRAKDLFTSVQYPPVQMINRISRLLAKHWDNIAE